MTSAEWNLNSVTWTSGGALRLSVADGHAPPRSHAAGHETPDVLPADLRGRWERFAARVAAHEQRHVDVYLEGAKAMKARLEATRTTVSCADSRKRSTLRGGRSRRTSSARRRSSTPRTRPRPGASARRYRPGSTAPARGSSLWKRRSAASTPSSRSSASSRRWAPDLVAKHNGLAGQRRGLAEEYGRLAADANGLIDALNWARW